MTAQVSRALEQVRTEILERGRQQSVDLAPYFAASEQRLLVLGALIAEELTRQGTGADRTALARHAIDTLSQVIAERLPAEHGFFTRNAAVLTLVADGIAGHLDPAAGAVPQDATGTDTTPRVPAERTKANVRAMEILGRVLKDGGTITEDERTDLRQYTGFGGLSLDRLPTHLPESVRPEPRALIHEYYTPLTVARAIARSLRERLGGLAEPDGRIVGLEPSAGIGRFLDATRTEFAGVAEVAWHAVEASRVSANLLRLTRPEAKVFEGPLEDWVGQHAALRGQIGLVLSNPPYGVRGALAVRDADRTYRERRADAYQMRRTLDFLRPGGIAVYIVPYGVLTGRNAERMDLRKKLLRRGHLMAAFRLPSEAEDGTPLFPGAMIVTDVIYLRARTAELTEVAAEDASIIAGKYFAEHPSHVLGTIFGEEEDEQGRVRKARWGFQVRGDFVEIPAFVERPLCSACVPLAMRGVPKPTQPAALPGEVQDAVRLARQTSAYLADVSRGDEEAVQRAAARQPELKAALLAWHGQDPRDRLAVTHFAGVVDLHALTSAMMDGKLLPSIEHGPTYTPRFVGTADDLSAQARFLYGQKRRMSLAALTAFHRSLGGSLDEAAVRAAILTADHCLDWVDDDLLVVPARDYYTGALWARYDRAKSLADSGDTQAGVQAQRLLEVIGPATFADLKLEPRLGWLPDAVIGAWVRHVLQTKTNFVRVHGLLTPWGQDYEDVEDAELRVILGYINHDMPYFRPYVRHGENLDEKRKEMAEVLRQNFVAWIEDAPEQQALVVDAHNRRYRGWKQPTFDEGELGIPRWNMAHPLYGFQRAGVRRLNANHGGGLFFDVGLGKTRTLLAALALARQEGWARRPVIVVPGSVVWNWVAEIGRVLPDFRVVLLGAKQKQMMRGARKGQMASETDTPQERASKWQRFKAGLYDVAILTYSTLPRTGMQPAGLLPLVRESGAIQREIGFRARSILQRIEFLKKRSPTNRALAEELAGLQARYGVMSERKRAIKAEQEESFVARLLELPAGQASDPGIDWAELGIDWLAFDESHIGKNLWTVGEREGGHPKFLGAPQEGSHIAWQMFFRAYLVRKNAGGAGVHVADATPAKNSPLEFLSVLSLLDDGIWERLGIADPEQYLTQYLKIRHQLIQDTNLKVKTAPCVVGFQNLDQLREVLYRYGEFRTAKQVGLKIPEPRVERFEVAMDERQEAKYTAYLKLYEETLKSPSPESRMTALGLMQRMALVAVHAELDQGPPGEGWSYATAAQATSYASPKLDKIAEMVSRKKDCGHIVFLENNAAHYWLKQRMVANGVRAERVAVLNGETAANTLERQRIAEGFTTHEPPLYDVVIANRIAYEGLNLQTRTCAIYHGDLPWEPATLQQRNGRGQRQGNRFDVIDIYYVLAKRSMDMARFQLIAGKREWMAELLESAASETNNPGAQVEMSAEQWLIYLSRNPAQTKLMLKSRRAAQVAEDEGRLRKLAWTLVRGIAKRQRSLAGAAEFQVERLRAEIAAAGKELEAIDERIWPEKTLLPYLLRHKTLVLPPQGAIWEGAVYERIRSGVRVDREEFGRLVEVPKLMIGHRVGALKWEALSPEKAFDYYRHTLPGDWLEGAEPTLPTNKDMVAYYQQVRETGTWAYRTLRLDMATERFVSGLWELHGTTIADAIQQSSDAMKAALPRLDAQGNLILSRGVEVLPFTEAGYQRFLTKAQQSSLSRSALAQIADWWWGRRIPNELKIGNQHNQRSE